MEEGSSYVTGVSSGKADMERRSVDTSFLVMAECMSLMALMRHNTRLVKTGIAAILGVPEDDSDEPEFGEKLRTPRPQRADQDLLRRFGQLRFSVASGKDLDALMIVQPFVEVIRSPVVSGVITSSALDALEKFFALGVIKKDSINAEEALNDLAHSLTHCRFEGTDTREDDAVLLHLMVVLDRMIHSPCIRLLHRQAVLEITETCLSLACQPRRGGSLRQCVVATLISFMRIIFGEFDPRTTYEVLKVLVLVLNPADRAVMADATRITVLQILRNCFEVSGHNIGQDEKLLELIGNQLWRNIALLVRREHPSLVAEALSLAMVIMNTCPEQFKLQFELVLVYVLTSLTPLADLPANDGFYEGVPARPRCVKAPPIEPGTDTAQLPSAARLKTPELREVMVEAVVRMAIVNPAFWPSLYASYDCDVSSPDLASDLLGFLCRNAYPDSSTWSTASVPPLCLEAILHALRVWHDILVPESTPPPYLSSIDRKQRETLVADTFNKSPKDGVKAMIEQKLVKDDSPPEIGRFLRECRRLNKAVLGQFLAKPANQEILGYFIQEFDFSNMRMDEALRSFLCSFRLPGESRQIELIIDKFAAQFMSGEGNSNDVASADAAFILAYAVIMLNTDQHSPSVKRRMDFDAWSRQLKGANSGSDFQPDYVRAMFDGIAQREIVLPDEHDTEESFDMEWRQVQQEAPRTTPYKVVKSPAVVAALLKRTWRPVVSTLLYIFATATDDVVFSRVIQGFHELAVLGQRYELSGCVDAIVAALARISTLASGDLRSPRNNIEVRIVDSEKTHSVVVSDLSVPFGSDLKAQMASITLFRLVRIAEPSSQGWGLVGKMLANLHIYSVGPSILPEIPAVTPCHTFERSKSGKAVGIFSALSSYLTSAPDQPVEPSDEDVDAALGAEDCVNACKLSVESFKERKLLQGALDVLPEPPSEKEYAPAASFLLRLAYRLANTEEDFNKVAAAAHARPGAGVDTLALAASRAHNSQYLEDALDSGKISLDVLLQLHPSPKVWSLLMEADDTVKVHSYCLAHLETAAAPVLGHCLQKNFEVADTLSKLANESKTEDTYLAALTALANGSASALPKSRERSLAALQKTLLAPPTDISVTWQVLVDHVLLPHLMELLLKPEIYKRDPAGMDFTRQQAASLLGKVFLQHALNDEVDLEDAWGRVMKALDRLLSSRRQPALHESVEEMLKNVILVLRTAGKGTDRFWTETQKALKGFLPDIAPMVNQSLEPEQDSEDTKAEDQEDH